MPGTLVSGATAHQFAGNGAGQRQSRKGHMTLPGSSPVSVEADRKVHGGSETRISLLMCRGCRDFH